MLEAIVDIGDLEDFPSNTIPGFYERLSSWLPSLIEHRCSYGERGGFLRRLKEGPGQATFSSMLRLNCKIWRVCRAVLAEPVKLRCAAFTR